MVDNIRSAEQAIGKMNYNVVNLPKKFKWQEINLCCETNRRKVKNLLVKILR